MSEPRRIPDWMAPALAAWQERHGFLRRVGGTPFMDAVERHVKREADAYLFRLMLERGRGLDPLFATAESYIGTRR